MNKKDTGTTYYDFEEIYQNETGLDVYDYYTSNYDGKDYQKYSDNYIYWLEDKLGECMLNNGVKVL